ncbi:MAG: Gfo/Idh/MocA family oxidoreductase, partial [Kiritimatiellia bacterium]|nr:Gfo/Idh/MocA family oxidoreductase [Kiritimatiellia bacterium]
NMKSYKYISMWAGPPNFKGVFDVEDYATGLVRFGRKATMSFEIAWAANAEETGSIEFLGDKGGLRIFDGKPCLLRTEHQGHLADIQLRYPDPGNSFHIQAKKFLAACRGECAPAATGREGLIAMKLIDAVYQSSQLGKEVAIR